MAARTTDITFGKLAGVVVTIALALIGFYAKMESAVAAGEERDRNLKDRIERSEDRRKDDKAELAKHLARLEAKIDRLIERGN